MLGTLNELQIEQVLQSERIGRIGCHAGGRTYVVPVTYAYDGWCVYGHTTEGMKIAMMRANPEVCFEVESISDPGSWRTVIAWGTYQELVGEDAVRGQQILLDRLMPVLVTSITARPAPGIEVAASTREAATAGRQAVIYRIRLVEKTGRFEQR